MLHQTPSGGDTSVDLYWLAGGVASWTNTSSETFSFSCCAAVGTLRKTAGAQTSMWEFIGGRLFPIDNYVTETMDVFLAVDLPPIFVLIIAVVKMKEAVKECYSFLHSIAAFLLRRIPKRLRKWFNFESDHHGYHCSQAISQAYRVSGFDLRHGLADWATPPGGLAKSKRLQHLGRLEF